MLVEEEHSRQTLDNLLLSTKSLLNEENQRIIEKINSLRSNSNVPLYMLVMEYRRQTDKLREKIIFGSK